MVRICFAVVFIVFSVGSRAQLIVNVENSRIQSDTTGWKGNVGTSFSFTKNVQQVLNINANAHLQYKTVNDLYLFLANFNLLKSQQQQLVNNVFFHLRYNRKLGKVVRWEAFTQWQQNKINNIELRSLLGTGPRFKLHESRKFKIYLGALTMYEHEADKDPKAIYNDLRADNYASFTFKPDEIFDATSTTFYQPLFRKFNDYRLLNQIVFNVRATKHFTISANWDYSYDAFPAVGTPRANFTITNGFSYNF